MASSAPLDLPAAMVHVLPDPPFPMTLSRPPKLDDSSLVDCDFFVHAIADVESGRQPRLTGSHGERGLMQIRRETWREVTRALYDRPLSFDYAFNPHWNLLVGRAYLAKLASFVRANRSRWGASERELILACYNAGPERVARAGFRLRGLPASTREYVHRAVNQHDALLARGEVPSVPRG